MTIAAVTIPVEMAVAVKGVTKQKRALLSLEETEEHWGWMLRDRGFADVAAARFLALFMVMYSSAVESVLVVEVS